MQAEPPYLFFSAAGTDRGSVLRSSISSISWFLFLIQHLQKLRHTLRDIAVSFVIKIDRLACKFRGQLVVHHVRVRHCPFDKCVTHKGRAQTGTCHIISSHLLVQCQDRLRSESIPCPAALRYILLSGVSMTNGESENCSSGTSGYCGARNCSVMIFSRLGPILFKIAAYAHAAFISVRDKTLAEINLHYSLSKRDLLPIWLCLKRILPGNLNHTSFVLLTVSLQDPLCYSAYIFFIVSAVRTILIISIFQKSV